MVIYQTCGAFLGVGGNVPHCCLRCGWVPIEGMEKFLSIHGDEARCLGACGEILPHNPPFVDPYEEAP